MNALKMGAIGTVVFGVLLISGRADEKQTAKSPAKNAGFDRIKALNGEWAVARAPGEHGMPGGTVTYKITAGGSAVLETLFGGTEHEMVTMYFMNGDDLSLTHYCMLQNRPHMRAEPQESADKIVFKCRDRKNSVIEAEDHMHQVTFSFVDPDHVKTEWILYKGGKRDSAHSFELSRKKK